MLVGYLQLLDAARVSRSVITFFSLCRQVGKFSTLAHWGLRSDVDNSSYSPLSLPVSSTCPLRNTLLALYSDTLDEYSQKGE